MWRVQIFKGKTKTPHSLFYEWGGKYGIKSLTTFVSF